MNNMSGTRYFSKIDLSQAYNQIELDDSKKYTVINTHRGLYRYNRLVYGLSSSPGIFLIIMCNLLSGIPNVKVFLDDIIIGGKTVNKFHQYLYGRRFVLRTDHKPLVSIFGTDRGIPTMVASRMTRWAIIFSNYSYDIEYVHIDQNGADGLSRRRFRRKIIRY